MAVTPGPQSVDRALAVLDVVADADRPVGAKALARRLGCALSTVYHVTGPLLARAIWSVRPRVRPRTPGPGAAPLPPAAPRARCRNRRAAGAAAEGHRGGGVPHGVPGRSDHRRRHHGSGHRHRPPLHAGPRGQGPRDRPRKALLAALPRPLRRRYLAEHGMARFTERTITSAERFEAEVERVRGQGFAVSVGEADLAYTCLAVALPERGDGIVHALSVSLPTAEFARRQGEIRAALTRAAPEFPAVP
ncbi:helix-turn-helix domain-containing protein [Streptomyces diastatochromogenes]|nr:helix-turn-helix domain-containing protein [Streptomyces diastatochromogenes]